VESILHKADSTDAGKPAAFCTTCNHRLWCYYVGVPQKELIDRLTALGLTAYEAKAYVALIRRDSSTAVDVARVASLPRQRVYDVMESLVDKGLASGRPGRPVKYTPSAPAIAIERLVADRRNALAELEEEANATIEQLTPAFRAGQIHHDPLEFIEVLRDHRAINERFQELQSAVKREILVFTKPPYATPPQENVQGLRLINGHSARSVYEFSLFDDPAHVEGVRRFLDAGEDARFVAELPLKLVIIDATIVMFGMQDPVAESSELTMVVVEHPSLAKVLMLAFDAVWAQGLTFDQAYDRLVTRRTQTA
jgi:HTH-type transcriptional regulator, sugar sensing transcriptional regulator